MPEKYDSAVQAIIGLKDDSPYIDGISDDDQEKIARYLLGELGESVPDEWDHN